MITIDHICLTKAHNNLNLATSSTCQKILGRLHTASPVLVLVEFPVNMYKQVTALQPSTNTSFTTNQPFISIYLSIIYTDCEMLPLIEAHFMIQWAENQLQIWIFFLTEGFRGKKSRVISNFDCSVQLIWLISYYHKIEWPDGIQLGVTQILFLEKRTELILNVYWITSFLKPFFLWTYIKVNFTRSPVSHMFVSAIIPRSLVIRLIRA